MAEDDLNLGQMRERFSSGRTRSGYALFLSHGYTVIL
jgi:hypothetical protein